MFELDGKVALVTGAGQGVGKGIALALAEQGASVAINDFFPDRAESVVEELTNRGVATVAVPFDASVLGEVEDGVATVQSGLGPIDILVANVGTLPRGQGLCKFTEMPPSDWTAFIDNNLYSAMNCIHAVAAGMQERGWGRLIGISSDAGRVGHYGSSVYGAGKAGMDGLMRSLAKEMGRHGVTANSIALGLIDTVPAEFAKGAERHYATGRIGTPRDVGAAVAYLASTEASWVSGHCLVVNGASYGG